MNPVTDPALIAQLESGSRGSQQPAMQPQQQQQAQPINDPALIAQLEKQQKIDQINKIFSNSPSGLLTRGIENFGGSHLRNIEAGALHGLQGMAKMLPDLSTLPGSEGLFPAKGKGLMDQDVYKAMGTTDQPFNPFLGGKKTLAGAEQTLGEFGMPAVGTYKLGKGIIGAGRKVYEAAKEGVSPLKYAKQLLNSLGEGAQTSEDISTSLGRDIKNAHDMRKDESTIYLNHVKDRVGDKEIYKKPDPLISTEFDKQRAMINEAKEFGVGDLYDKFKAKPTFTNAHNLHSELGVMLGDLTKNPYKTIAQNHEIHNLKQVRDRLGSHMDEFLDKHDMNSNENLSSAWKRGIDLYRENVAPYLQSKKLRDIVRGGKKTVKNIHTIFDTPSDVVNPVTGEETLAHQRKIMQDLPENAKGKVLFSKIGSSKNAENPDLLVKSINDARNSGYQDYVGKDLETKLNDIMTKSRHQKYLKNTAKALGYGTLAGGTEELIRRKL